MNFNKMIDIIKGKTDAVKSKVKNFIDNDPKKAAAYGLLGAGAASVTYSLASGDAEQITGALGNAAGAVSRTVSLYTPEIVGNTAFAADFFGNALSGVDYHQILEEEGLLKGGGAVLVAGVGQVKNNYGELDSPYKKKVKQGALLAVIATGVSLSGCLGSGEVKTPPVVESNYQQVETAAVESTPAVETATVEPTPEATVEASNWWDEKDNYEYGVHSTDAFGDIEGVMCDNLEKHAVYIIYNEDQDKIFVHGVNTHKTLDLAYELLPEDYSALTNKYGVMDNVITETDYEKGLVTIRYEGSKGAFDYTSDNPDKGVVRLIEDYMEKENLI